jgi:hypothetical protein
MAPIEGAEGLGVAPARCQQVLVAQSVEVVDNPFLS